MTFEQFLTDSMNTPTNLRRGQFAVNLLSQVRYDLYESLTENGLGVDPFYDDTLIPKFLVWAGENW